ncbi:MAG: hypothetical protein NZ556_02135 [Fimbriimonadales bacterium]|nr:hypothetical protein [Fimbriimonadales bacterium]
MKFRWSGAVAYDAEAAAARLREYLGAIGYQARDADALHWRRGSRWKALTTLSPRQLPIAIEAKLQPWGAQTLVDVTFEFSRGMRVLSEQDADLIVAELRGLTEYLQRGAADFEAMARLERLATRRARFALLNTLGAVVLISIPLTYTLSLLHLPAPLASTLGGVVGGLVTSLLFWRLMRGR